MYPSTERKSSDIRRYGNVSCTSQERRGRCIGWVQKDKPYTGLRNQGGSCCNKLYPGDVFDVISRFSNKCKRYLYCGRKGNARILITLPDYTYTPVPNDFLRGATGKIRKDVEILLQTNEQLEESKKLARKIMRKKEHEGKQRKRL